MKQQSWIFGGVLAGVFTISSPSIIAQAKMTAVPDAQVESDVLRALAANPKLADQTISSNTVYGTVTLSGRVRDEESRTLAETIVSKTHGVQKVVDELTLGMDSASSVAAPDQTQATPADAGSAPLLQSDGTLAPAPPSPSNADQQEPAYAQQQTPEVQPNQPAPPSPYGSSPYGNQPSYDNQSPYGDQPSNRQQPYGQPPSNQPQYGQPQYGQPQYGHRDGSSQPPNAGPAHYGAQLGGQPVTIPIGSMLRIRINQGLDSKHTQPGTTFDAVVLNDVVADGFVAIPRGAAVQGTVVESHRAGAIKGRGELALQLTQLILAGRAFPIASDVWSDFGPDKTARTVNSALGLGAVGAIIGGVTGGGAGAAIGAGVGGAAGVGASAASGGGQAFVPPEAILTFRLTQPAAIATVSQAEMDRLGYGVPAGAQIRRRYVRPAPYGYPVYYPRAPYPYPY